MYNSQRETKLAQYYEVPNNNYTHVSFLQYYSLKVMNTKTIVTSALCPLLKVFKPIWLEKYYKKVKINIQKAFPHSVLLRKISVYARLYFKRLTG